MEGRGNALVPVRSLYLNICKTGCVVLKEVPSMLCVLSNSFQRGL